MSETADALLALARHFDFKASIEQHGPGAVAAWEHAAEAARDAAAGETASPDGGEAEGVSVELRATEADPREPLGKLVRDTWISWAREQYRPKDSWLVPWGELGHGQREVDMRIGEAVAAAERERIRTVIDPAQLRKLADWFDTDDEFKTTMFPGTWPQRGHEVQDDLRAWAGLLEQP